MDVVARPGDSLVQPTRAKLFALLGELRRPAPTDELAERLGLHPNGVRNHLEQLREAGLVTRERERLARGRPRDVWSISPEAAPGGERPTAYADLGRWLVRVIAEGGEGPVDVEGVGREIGRELAPGGGDVSPEQRLHAALTAMGFQPRREGGDGGAVTYCLGNCPYRDVVRERWQVVCGLHRGMTRGLLDEIDPSAELAAFVPENPDRAGCLIRIDGAKNT